MTAAIKSKQAENQRYWAVVPAAGVGARMQADRPKQYLSLAGKTVIEHSLDRLLQHPKIAGCVVAISAGDAYWPEINVRYSQQQHKPVWVASGGKERCDSVLSALTLLRGQADDADWVLVHDAARPCLRQEDIDHLMAQCASHAVGGILAVPVRDTIKRACSGTNNGETEICETVDRSQLWHAQTPQMFRLGDLTQVLTAALENNMVITDEASAQEWSGKQPLLVEGHADNIKITRPEDLALAEIFLQSQQFV